MSDSHWITEWLAWVFYVWHVPLVKKVSKAHFTQECNWSTMNETCETKISSVKISRITAITKQDPSKPFAWIIIMYFWFYCSFFSSVLFSLFLSLTFGPSTWLFVPCDSEPLPSRRLSFFFKRSLQIYKRKEMFIWHKLAHYSFFIQNSIWGGSGII